VVIIISQKPRKKRQSIVIFVKTIKGEEIMGFSDAFSALGGIFGQVKSSGDGLGEFFKNFHTIVRRT
jgi:hypothetical protein